MPNCDHNCGGCGQTCAERETPVLLEDTKISKIIAVLSGKGGVGKSMVTSMLAVELANKGYKVGILDADITGPSIPKIFGLSGDLDGDEKGVFPAVTSKGIRVLSINMMLDSEESPVLWRGPILGGVIRQFYYEVHWGELDYLLVDMPPGTSDVAISVIQELPVDSFVMVTSPSRLVSMVVAKAINMARQVNKNIAGLVENMAYVKCPDCGKEIHIYGNDDTDNVAEKYDLDILARLPIDPELAVLSDEGRIEEYDGELLKGVVEKIYEL